MSKKFIYSLLTGFLAVSVLAACGEVEEDPGMEESPGMEEDGGLE